MCMELQLGLALPTTPPIPTRMFDLNSYDYESRQSLCSNNLSRRPSPLPGDINNFNCSNSSSSSSSSNRGSRKRGFDDEHHENRDVPKTLPLLLWVSKQPNDEEDSKDLEEEDDYCSAIFKNGEGLIGWPPVKTWRKKLRRQNINPDGEAQNNTRVAGAVAADNGCVGTSSNSTYVKVKMEGMAIARKIDLSVHHSFETLTSTLMRMFGISDEKWESFKLTYQDREGDWLLAEDVPWRTFIRSLKRLKLIRSRV